MTAPFRWHIEKESEVAGLLEGLPAPSLHGLLDDLRSCAARVLALSRDSDLVFVGRSPENLNDYLKGVLHGTSWAHRISSLNISLRAVSVAALKRDFPDKLAVAKAHFRELRLDPETLIHRERPVALVDLVCYGWTFESLSDFLLSWAEEEQIDVPALRRKLRFLGITSRSTPRPKCKNSVDKASWLRPFPKDAVRLSPIDWPLWNTWGNEQQKTVVSNPPGCWGRRDLQRPPHRKENLEALRLAVELYRQGRARTERLALARALSAQPEMQHGWLRGLVGELRGRRRSSRLGLGR